MICSEYDAENWGGLAGVCGDDWGCDVIFDVAAIGMLDSAAGARSEEVLARAKLCRWACRDREVSSTGSKRGIAAVSDALL